MNILWSATYITSVNIPDCMKKVKYPFAIWEKKILCEYLGGRSVMGHSREKLNGPSPGAAQRGDS